MYIEEMTPKYLPSNSVRSTRSWLVWSLEYFWNKRLNNNLNHLLLLALCHMTNNKIRLTSKAKTWAAILNQCMLDLHRSNICIRQAYRWTLINNSPRWVWLAQHTGMGRKASWTTWTPLKGQTVLVMSWVLTKIINLLFNNSKNWVTTMILI